MGFACAIMLILAAPAPALAAGQYLTVNQGFEMTGEAPDTVTDTFDYALTALSEDAVLPAGAIDGVFSFSLVGDGASISLPVQEAGDDALVFSHAGVYSYGLACTSVADADGMTVDSSVYSISIVVENDDAGLRVGQIIVRDESGEKPAEIRYAHSFKGVGDAPPALEPRKESPKPFVFPKTGDALWTLMVVGGVLCAVGIAAVFVAVVLRRRSRGRGN